MASTFLLNNSQGARLLSGEYDYVNRSGDTFYYADTQGVSASVNIGSVASGSTLSRRASSWVLSAGQSNIHQIEPASSTQPFAVPTGGVETQDIQDDAVTAAKVADGAIDDTAKIAAGVIVNADINASAAIATSKLALTPTAFTQTYATADATHANLTSADLATTAATQTTPWGFATQAQAENIATQVNALRADLTDLKQLVNSVVDTLQANGLAT